MPMGEELDREELAATAGVEERAGIAAWTEPELGEEEEEVLDAVDVVDVGDVVDVVDVNVVDVVDVVDNII